jgi:hypothetical protein
MEGMHVNSRGQGCRAKKLVGKGFQISLCPMDKKKNALVAQLVERGSASCGCGFDSHRACCSKPANFNSILGEYGDVLRRRADRSAFRSSPGLSGRNESEIRGGRVRSYARISLPVGSFAGLISNRVRARQLFEALEIVSVADLYTYTRAELVSARHGAGERTVQEICFWALNEFKMPVASN